MRDPPSPGRAAAIASSWGLVCGPLLAIACGFLLPAETLSDEARATASIGILMAVYWMTEALPLPVTALLPLVLFPLASVFPETEGGVAQLARAASPYARPVIFLFLGGFMIALAVERWNLHRRIALLTVLVVGTRPSRLIAGIMTVTALLSMWLSNTATTVMMLPIGLSLSQLLQQDPRAPAATTRHFGACMMLSIAYAASIGGVGTLIGTPPNVFLAGYLRDSFGMEIGFGRWLAAALPLVAVFLAVAWCVLTRWAFPVSDACIPGGMDFVRDELRKLGPFSRGEKAVLGVFLVTAALWILREPLGRWDAFVSYLPAWKQLNDATIAIAGAVLLFAIPVDRRQRVFALDWETARRLPWGVLLLFGGGLSLAAAVSETGLAIWIAGQLPESLPLLPLVVLVTLMVIFLTELTSNTATASVFLPVLGGIAAGSGSDVLLLAVPAALAASCAFMLPVATPPNAIVFGSGEVRIADMVKAGFWLNLAGLVLIPLAAYTTMAWLLGTGS